MAELTRTAEFQDLRSKWGWFVALGALLIILGLIGMVYTVAFTLTTLIVFGILLVIGGVGQILHAFYAIRWSGFFLMVFMGIMCIILGLFMFNYPVAAALEWTLFIALLLIFSGAF